MMRQVMIMDLIALFVAHPAIGHVEFPQPASGQNLTESTQQNPAELGLSKTDAGTKRQVLTTRYGAPWVAVPQMAGTGVL